MFAARVRVLFCVLGALTLTGAPQALSADISAGDEAGLSAVELLGKRIFEDTALSEPEGQACASCHEARLAFTGNFNSRFSAVAAGSRPDHFGTRNAPSAMYMAFSPPFSFVKEKGENGETEYTPTGGQFWDGRASSLADQARGPFVNPSEMNNLNEGAVVAKVKAAPYALLMTSAFGPSAFADDKKAFDNIVAAVAAFESTSRFVPFSSKFDDYLRGKVQLNAQEARGLALFKDPEKGNCIACHAGDADSKDPKDWLFTDFTYDNLGLPRNATIPGNADAANFDLGLCKQPGIESVLPKEVRLESLCGAFKVPTLRNVAVTAPYFHNGVFASLREAVKFYVTRDTDPGLWFPKEANGAVLKFNDLPPSYQNNVNIEEAPYDRKPGQSPRLSDAEIDDLVAFLHTLTDNALAH